MKKDQIDPARLAILLAELRLPAVRELWETFAERADKEGWPASRFLFALAEHELAERDRRRVLRNLNQARLLPGKTLDAFDFGTLPMVSKAHVGAITAGDGWINKGANILLFGPPGVGKSHLACAIGHALVENGYRVLFARTTDLVQKLQQARKDLTLQSAIAKLDKFHLLITANQPFGAWNAIFPDPAMTLAAVDRLVHHATIFEMNVESYRRRQAAENKRQRHPASEPNNSIPKSD